LGDRHDIVRLSDELKIDMIVVAIHNISGQSFREILMYCERTKALIKVVPDVFKMVGDVQNAAMLRDVLPEDLIGRSVIGRNEHVDLSPVSGKIVMVTGAAGSIGAELSRQILEYAPRKLIILDNNESGLYDLQIELKTRITNTELVTSLTDVSRRDVLDKVYRQHRPQVVFHAAAYKHVPMLEEYPQEALRVNVLGTLNAIELANATSVERFVLISTDKAVNPSSVMGATKRLGELMLHVAAHRANNVTLFTAVRFGNVLNSRGSVVPTFNKQIDAGGPITVTDRNMTRYFMSIPEAVNLIIHAACLTQGDDIFILKMGDVVRIVELAERMIRMRGLRPYQDIKINFTGMRPGEKMHEELLNDFEVTEATPHSGIVKHHSWEPHFSVSAFDERLAHLLQQTLQPATALNALLNVINASEQESTVDVIALPERTA
jgi:FlaA1/EpsC-like NDP-sugar epimerase